MEEVWKDIPGYEGLYQVSNRGNVRSLNWGNRGIIRNLYLKKHNRGYRHVELTKNGQRKAFTVHRLVATVFIPNPNKHPSINHKDEDRTNNRVENLEWCTHSYNVRYSDARRSRKGKHYGRKIVQTDDDGCFVAEWPDLVALKKQTGFHPWSIVQCCDGHRKTAYGFKWQFADEYNR